MTRSIGMILLCIWLIVSGVLVLTNITFALAQPVMALVAIAAGVLLLFGR